MTTLHKCYSLIQFQNVGASVEMHTTEEDVTEPEQPPPSKKFRYLSSILFEKKKEQASSRSTSPCLMPEQEEVRLYASSELDINEDIDPLQFWMENESTYPLLASLAFDVLSIPASSAPVERVFSTAGLVSSGRRNRLSDRNLEREIMLKRNMSFL